jgi:hypothetical protein
MRDGSRTHIRLKLLPAKSGSVVSMMHGLRTRRIMHKHFSERDHRINDEAARGSAKAFWSAQGYTVTDNPNTYGVDLIAEKDKKRIYLEVEVKHTWHGIDFKYPTMHLPLRKAKFLDKPTVFMIFNSFLSHAALIGRKTVRSAEIVVVPNKKVSAGEKFYSIPVENVKFVYTLA